MVFRNLNADLSSLNVMSSGTFCRILAKSSQKLSNTFVQKKEKVLKQLAT